MSLSYDANVNLTRERAAKNNSVTNSSPTIQA